MTGKGCAPSILRMSHHYLPRRHFLGLAGLAGASVASGTARAFHIQDAPPATRELYRLACETPSKHLQLLAEIDAQLAGRQLSADDIQAIKARATCPLCGCSLTSAEPHVSPGDQPATDSTL